MVLRSYSGDFFDVLGATPVLGRALRREDDVVGASPAIVLSYRAWQDRFGGAPDVIGRSVVAQVNDENFKIVGVMPQGLDFPRGVDVWSAERATVPGGDMTTWRSTWWVVWHRLRPSRRPATS